MFACCLTAEFAVASSIPGGGRPDSPGINLLAVFHERKRMNEIYVSTDVEADGPIPGPHSMLSIGSAAFLESGELLGTFSANLLILEGATVDLATMEWWSREPEAWKKTREGAREPRIVMLEYAEWLKTLPGRVVFVGYPVAYDFMWVYWYLMKFVGASPFSHSALDIKTLAMAAMGTGFRETTKGRMPSHWFGPEAHTHVAVEDAIGQGVLFCNVLKAVRGLNGRAGRGEP